eukprot:GILJ01012766.1.p1 GENE.GILJ01012766.1~~GILJ01012766.1.p1  ORF type:complete len:225 (-),score=29.25 GILJ01012766.1:168-800(-)
MEQQDRDISDAYVDGAHENDHHGHHDYHSLTGFHLRGKAVDAYDAVKDRFFMHGVDDDVDVHVYPNHHSFEERDVAPKKVVNVSPEAIQRSYYNPQSAGPASNLADIAASYQAKKQKAYAASPQNIIVSKPLFASQEALPQRKGVLSTFFGAQRVDDSVPQDPDTLTAYHYSSCDIPLQRYEECLDGHSGSAASCQHSWNIFSACRKSEI